MTNLVDGFFDESGYVHVYTFDTSTGELLDEHDVYVSQGGGLPAGATLDAPPTPGEHQVVVRQNNAWAVVPDFRGLAYRTIDGAEQTYSMPGELPVELTTLPRPSAAHVWEGGQWTLDAELALALKTRRETAWIENELHWAGREVDKHQDADPTAIGTEEDWRKYRVELRAWPDNESFPDADKRPQPPAP